MSLDVATPDPPTIFVGSPEETTAYDEERRAELQAFFEAENAWGEAFSEWAEETQLVEDEYAAVVELGLVEAFDFYWDGEAERVDYSAPEVPDDWQTREYHSALTSWDTVSKIDEELDGLGRTVADTLTDYYVDWEPSEDPESEYHQLFGSQFNAADDTLPESESESEQ
ncbi:MAG: hypothetical protein ACQETI_03980 [Halobacteriota archaeon]